MLLNSALISLFLSTPSARRATCQASFVYSFQSFLSTPSARRATNIMLRAEQIWDISIHALREEGDRKILHRHGIPKISIHALREEGDRGSLTAFLSLFIFLSTPSARRATCRPACTALFCSYFYPRPPRGGRLWEHWKEFMGENISIHALREEGDVIQAIKGPWQT